MSAAPDAGNGSGVFFTFAGPHTIGLRCVDLDVDAACLHDWFSRDYARFWGLQHKSLDEVRQRLSRVLRQPDRELLMGLLMPTGERLFMLECYRPEHDVLGRHYAVQAGDRGFHLIVAPPEQRIAGLTYFIMGAVDSYLFRDPSAQRIVAEPDIRNHKMLVRCAQAGYQIGQALYLPAKTARLVWLTRERFAQLDLAHAPPKPSVPRQAARVGLHRLAAALVRLLVRIARKLRLVSYPA